MLKYFKNIILILFLSTFLLASCGKKGPIYPPNQIPAKKNYKITQN